MDGLFEHQYQHLYKNCEASIQGRKIQFCRLIDVWNVIVGTRTAYWLGEILKK